MNDFEGVNAEEANAGLGRLGGGARGLYSGGPQVQVGEGPADAPCVLNDGEDIHARTAACTYERLDLVGLADEAGPASAEGRGRPVGVGNGRPWLRQSQ